MPSRHAGPLPREHRPPFRVGTPEFDEEIRRVVDACNADHSYENRVIEPLAGMFWPQVRAAIQAERACRAAALPSKRQ